jgi:hypothetical protein
MTPEVKIRHRINEPSGVVAQLMLGDDLIVEHKFDQDDHHEQKLLREVTAATADGDGAGAIELLFQGPINERRS